MATRPKTKIGEARVVGLDKLSAAYRALPGRYLRALAGALLEEAEEVMREAKLLTPVDTGTLRASGHVQLPIFEENRVRVLLGFGGPAGSGEGQGEDVGYAFRVHENELVFGTSPGGGSRADPDNPRRFRGRGRKRRARKFIGQAGYLRIPFEKRINGPGFRARLRARVRLRFGGS